MKPELNFRGLLWCQMDPDPKGEYFPVVSCDHSQEKDSNARDSTAHRGSSQAGRWGSARIPVIETSQCEVKG